MFCFLLSKGPTDEELCLAEEDDICLERDGRRSRREDEEQRWQERLQENWENCLVRVWRCGGWRGDGETHLSRLSPPLTHSLCHSLSSSQELNLSYQDLGDPFQQENFLRILRRLIRVEKLQLVDNSLTDLSSVRLPRCEPALCPRPECSTAILDIWSGIKM